MNVEVTRTIHSRASSSQVMDLLQTIFLAELLRPGGELWIMSPWISDIPIIDNRASQFLHLEPSWGGRYVKLSEVLCQLIVRGTKVYIVTRQVDHNKVFIKTMEQIATKDTILNIKIVREFHEKGILGCGYYLSGSMNFTYNGITINEEVLHYFTQPALVAEKKLAVRDRWGI